MSLQTELNELMSRKGYSQTQVARAFGKSPAVVNQYLQGKYQGDVKSIDELARSLGVSKAFHGHHHDRLDYSSHRERLGFDAFGVGFCGVSDVNGNAIRPGDFDEARASRQQHQGASF